jgi:hypothetical protein
MLEKLCSRYTHIRRTSSDLKCCCVSEKKAEAGRVVTITADAWKAERRAAVLRFFPEFALALLKIWIYV